MDTRGEVISDFPFPSTTGCFGLWRVCTATPVRAYSICVSLNLLLISEVRTVATAQIRIRQTN